jgi:hypothetical protein
VISPAQAAGFDAQQAVVVADVGQRQRALLELSRRR